jgi:hypothetical protein
MVTLKHALIPAVSFLLVEQAAIVFFLFERSQG